MGCQPLLQEHLPLTGIAPHSECGQVHSQVVLFCLKGKIQNKWRILWPSRCSKSSRGLPLLSSLQKSPARSNVQKPRAAISQVGQCTELSSAFAPASPLQ